MSAAELLVPTGIEPGWYPGLSIEEYLAIPAMSASGLESFRRSPAHFRYDQTHPKEPTPAMREGTALHLALLEPDLFAGRYVSLGRCDATKKDGTPCTNPAVVIRQHPAFGGYDDEQFCGVHDPQKGTPMRTGVHVLPAETLSRVEGMRQAILAHPEAGQFFRGRGASELTGVWCDEESGVLCKIRLDRDIGRAAIHADIKTTTTAEAQAFTRQCGRMGYVRRAAFYRRGMAALGKPAIGSVLIAAEFQPPHGVQAFCLDEGDIDGFQPEISRVLNQYAHCLETNDWPGYASGLRNLKLMPWDEPRSTSGDFDFEEEDLPDE